MAGNAELRRIFNFFAQKVGRPAVNAQHGFYFFPGIRTFYHKHRPDQVADADRIFRDEAARPVVRAIAAQERVADVAPSIDKEEEG